MLANTGLQEGQGCKEEDETQAREVNRGQVIMGFVCHADVWIYPEATGELLKGFK